MGQLNPFRLRDVKSPVSAGDILQGNALTNKYLQGALEGLGGFGKQINTNQLNDSIARGELEGLNTDQALQKIAQVGGTGGYSPEMQKTLEQMHQGRQQEDRQRAAEIAATTLNERQLERDKIKQAQSLELFKQKVAADPGSWTNAGNGVFVSTKTGETMDVWGALRATAAASKPDKTLKPTGEAAKLYSQLSPAEKQLFNTLQAQHPDMKVKSETKGEGKDKYTVRTFSLGGKEYPNLETLNAALNPEYGPQRQNSTDAIPDAPEGRAEKKSWGQKVGDTLIQALLGGGLGSLAAENFSETGISPARAIEEMFRGKE